MVDLEKLVTTQDVHRFLEHKGKRGVDVISVLGKHFPVLNIVLNTDIGKAILTETLQRMDVLSEKIVDETAGPEEKAEFRVMRVWVGKLAEKIGQYLQNIEEVKKVNAR